MNVIAKISCYLERSVVTLKLHKEYLNTVTYNTSVLLWIKKTEQFGKNVNTNSKVFTLCVDGY